MNELTTTFRIESPPAWLEIGYDAENNWRTITINCEYWFNIESNGTVVLMFKPACSKPAYPLKTERSGNSIVWTPESAELVAGVGTMQAFFEVDGTTIGASKKIPCEVDGSLLGSASGGTPPWAVDVIEEIKTLTGHYPYVADGKLYVWDSVTEQWIEFTSTGGGAVDSVNGKTGAVNLGAADVGAYVKPSTGIPKIDLAAAVQTSLGKADTALQEHQSLSGYATETYVQQQIAAIPDELPSVSASDNGKVLGVVNGAWAAKADEGGGGDSVQPTVITNFSGYQTAGCIINSEGKWAGLAGGNYVTALISLTSAVKSVRVKSGATESFVSVLKATGNVTNGGSTVFATGYSGRITTAAGETSNAIQIPSDATILAVTLISSGNSYQPERVTIYATSGGAGAGLIERVDDLETRVDELEEQTIETDTTLTVSGAAADAAATGTKINQINSILNGTSQQFNPITNFSGYDTHNGVVTGSAQWWNASGNQTAFVPIPQGAYQVTVTAGQTQAFFSVLKTAGTPANNDTPDFASGFNSRIAMESGQSETVQFGTDAKFVAVTLLSSNTSYAPSVVQFAASGEGLIAQVDALEETMTQLASLFTSLFNDTEINPQTSKLDGWFINSSNKWSGSTGLTCSLIPVGKNVSSIKITAGTNECYYALLKSANYANDTPADFATGYSSRLTLQAGESVEVNRPTDDSVILYVYLKNTQNVDYSPQSVVFREIGGGNSSESVVISDETVQKLRSALFGNLANAMTATGRDIPRHRGESLGYRRAHQLTDLVWTALSAVPTVSSATGAAAGDHTGMIYSSVKEMDKYVGYNVSIRTFMTAAHNPYSLLYTEDTLGSRSKSGYGFTYHGVNCGAYFGAVCNTFALYAIGMPINFNTAEFANLAEQGVFEKPYDQSAAGMKLMDIVWEPGHGNVILDIIRDDRGIPTTIYWAEQKHDFPEIHAYTPAQAQARLTQNSAIIYRWTEQYKGIEYEPSQFVAVEDEVISTPYVYNDDICTYAGDYAAFYSGEPVHINYAKGSYTSMQLYKGDTLIQTITLPSSYNTTHSVDVSSYLTGYGKYKARLTGGTNNSDYTYFEVIETNVTVSKSGNNLTVNFSSANGTPQYVQLTYRNGKSMGIYALSADEISAGKCTFNALDLANSQSYTGGFTETTYVKVFFIGDYGIVRNNPINTGLY